VELTRNYTFQFQVTYMSSNGEKWLRVFNKNMKLCIERSQTEPIISHVICLESIHSSARLAQAGEYDEARINLVSVQRLLQRSMKTPTNQSDYLAFIVQAEKLDQFMRENQQQEKIFGKEHNKKRDDAASNAMFQMKSVSLRIFRERK